MSHFGYLILFVVFSCGVKADENVVKQILDPQPIIAVDDVQSLKGASPSSVNSEPVVDTEAASPIAPQSFDGYEGIVQEVFAPTAVERQAMLKQKQMDEQKERALAARVEASSRTKSIVTRTSVKSVPRVVQRKVSSAPKPAPKLHGRRKSATVSK